MTEFIAQDMFYITGRGFVLTLALPIEEHDALRVDDEITFGHDEVFTITAIERFSNSMGLSRNIGILLRGNVNEDRNSYYGRKFTKVEKIESKGEMIMTDQTQVTEEVAELAPAAKPQKAVKTAIVTVAQQAGILVSFKGRVTRVKLPDGTTGKAKCDPTDTYDALLGYQVALARAEIRSNQKLIVVLRNRKLT